MKRNKKTPLRDADRKVDKTFLDLDRAEKKIHMHRDYIAHCFRWTHVLKFINQRKHTDIRVMDIGCGRKMPLATLCYSNRIMPKKYIGIDISNFELPEHLQTEKAQSVISVYNETDFCNLKRKHVLSDNKLPNVVVSFEVLEHMTPAHARAVMVNAKELSDANADFFISTPCWNGSAAENHINEMTYEAMGAMFEDLGYQIVNVYGTFASIADYKDQLKEYYVNDSLMYNLEPLFEQLRKYYDSNILSIIFAPLFPAHSRNCIWHLKKAPPLFNNNIFEPFDVIKQPWSQHKDWKDLAGKDFKITEIELNQDDLKDLW